MNSPLIFGDPEFSKTVQAEFPKLFEVLPRLTAALNDLTGRSCEKPEDASTGDSKSCTSIRYFHAGTS